MGFLNVWRDEGVQAIYEYHLLGSPCKNITWDDCPHVWRDYVFSLTPLHNILAKSNLVSHISINPNDHSAFSSSLQTYLCESFLLWDNIWRKIVFEGGISFVPQCLLIGFLDGLRDESIKDAMHTNTISQVLQERKLCEIIEHTLEVFVCFC